jgi:hypothetical protein
MYAIIFRMAKLTKKDVDAAVRAAFAKAGAAGGKARAKKLSKAELSEAGRKAVEVRWKKTKK